VAIDAWNRRAGIMEKLTPSVVIEYQEKSNLLQTFGEYKALGCEFRDKYGLTDREAIDLMNNRDVLRILSTKDA